MSRIGKWWRVAAMAAIPGMGCGLIHRPYANDPILRERQPIWGDPQRTRVEDRGPNVEPVPPPSPPPRVSPSNGWTSGG